MPEGRLPAMEIAARGQPAVVTVKAPGTPTPNVAEGEFVNEGGSVTTRVNIWTASGEVPFVAVIVSGWLPAPSAEGAPEIVAVPLPLSTNVSPAGIVSAMLIAGAGCPDALIVNV